MALPRSGSFPPMPPLPPGRPGTPERPGRPERPGTPGHPLPPSYTPPPPAPRGPDPALQPTRVWFEQAGWPDRVQGRLLEHRIVIAHGWLDGEAATSLSAQLLTLDAEGTRPIRLELHNLDAELAAALSVMGVLDVVRAPVSAHVAGRLRGPALGVLAATGHRLGYPNSVFVLNEPRLSFDGTVSAVASQEQQVRGMLAEFYARLAGVTGHDESQVRADAERERVFTLPEAIEYGLVQEQATPKSARRGSAG